MLRCEARRASKHMASTMFVVVTLACIGSNALPHAQQTREGVRCL